MVPEAPLEDTEHGRVAKGEGWFVLNARDARWYHVTGRGAFCDFEGDAEFTQLGINVQVLEPGDAMAMYHWEADQEDFLVVSGEALLLIEGEERELKAWDFVHCPPWTEHIFVGAGDGPCVVVGVGARRKGRGIVYPANETASKHGAGVDEETSDPRVAYARFSEDVPVSGHDVFPG
jgi:uncharacterized cupin superfamily protein